MGNASSSEDGAKSEHGNTGMPRHHHFRPNHQEDDASGKLPLDDNDATRPMAGYPSSYRVDTPQTGTTIATATCEEGPILSGSLSTRSSANPVVGGNSTNANSGADQDDENMHIEYAPEPEVSQPQQQAYKSDTNTNTTANASAPVRPGLRRKSTLLLDDREDEEADLRKLRESAHEEFTPLSRVGSGEEVDIATDEEEPEVETILEWKQGGHKVYVTGSFTGWRKMIKLHRQDDGTFRTILKLPIGTHRLRFVVDNELLCSNFLPTATDSMGNLVNYIELESGMKGPYAPGIGVPSQLPPQSQQEKRQPEHHHHHHNDQSGALAAQDINRKSSESSSNAPQPIKSFVEHKAGEVLDDQKYERFYDDQVLPTEPNYQYCDEIPQVFTDSEAMDRFVSSELVNPPQLPPHLEGVILNSNSNEKDNNSVLPIPNHVVLNHLATTSIKHNVLAVASISRYSQKYVTQILYAPLKDLEG